MPCREPCPIAPRIRERAESCVCERIAEAILTGDRAVLATMPGAAVQRAVKRTQAAEQRRASG